MKHYLLNFAAVCALALLGACASNGNESGRAADDKTLAEKWDEDQAKQDQRTCRDPESDQPQCQTALDRLDREAGSTLDRVGGSLNRGPGGLIGK